MPPGRQKTGKITMQDIADRLGISKVSVSKAFAHQRGVSEELRQKIFTAAQDMGYDRSESGSSYRFVFLVSKHFFLETDAFYSEMFYYFNKLCIADGHSATLIIVSDNNEQTLTLPAQLQKEVFSGLAVAGQMTDEYLQKLTTLQKPMMLLDFESRRVPCGAILTDNYYWGHYATQYLIDRGHRDIGFVGEVGGTNSITDRYFGYRKALMMNQLHYEDAWQLVNNDTQSGLYRTDITLPDKMPTAFVCHCDMAAHYLLNALTARGIRCPQDVSVVSFDNTKLAQINQPPLTSVSIDIRAFAQQALLSLTDLVQGKACENTRIYLHSALVIRDSVANRDAPDA